MLVSYGLKPEVARSKRDCGQLAKVGVAAALAELAPKAIGNVSSSGSAAGSQRRVPRMLMSALVYRSRAARDDAPGVRKYASRRHEPGLPYHPMTSPITFTEPAAL